MKKDSIRFFYFVLSLLLLINTNVVHAASDTDKDMFNKIDKYVLEEMKTIRIPGLSLGIVQGDKIIYMNGYGEADSKGNKVSTDTPFILGSITKTFTALAVRQLINEGKIEINAPVIKYLPWFRTSDKSESDKITINNLINHSSGFSTTEGNEYVSTHIDYALERKIQDLDKVKLAYPPGEGTQYSNINYGILGLVIEQVSGEKYDKYIQSHILIPLDMNNSFVMTKETVKNKMAAGHKIGFGFPIQSNLKVPEASVSAGYLASSAEDMCNYMLTYLHNGYFKGNSVIPNNDKYEDTSKNLAFDYDTYWNIMPVGTIAHSGGTSDFSTMMYINSSTRYGIIVLANLRNDSVADTNHILQGIYSILNGSKPIKASDEAFHKAYIVVNTISIILLILLIIHIIQFMILLKRLNKVSKFKKRNIFSCILIDLLLPIAVLVSGPIIFRNSSGQNLMWNDIMYATGLENTCLFIAALVLLAIGIIKTISFILIKKNFD